MQSIMQSMIPRGGGHGAILFAFRNLVQWVRQNGPAERAGRTPLCLTRCRHQVMVHFVKQTAAAPIIKVTPHRRDRQEVIGQHSPPASGRRDVKGSVENITQVGGSRSPDALGRKQKRRD
jgi:hypothetical protein